MDPLSPSQPDSLYEQEVAAARELSIACDLISFEALAFERDSQKAVQRVPQQEAITDAIYRGWMLTPEQYRQFYKALLARNVHLINDPAAYRHCHYLPESYSLIKEHTPNSVWLSYGPDTSIDEIMDLLIPFGGGPVIVKDYVKSQKHYWHEACFIPSASNRAAVESVVQRFLELQGDDLNEGLVFREFVEFEPLATHSKSGMPLTTEYRIFFLDGEPIYMAEYWEEGEYSNIALPMKQFQEVAQQVRSRFFTMDVAKRRDGGWMIVELGDGQVAGLPESIDSKQFFRFLTGLVEKNVR